MCRENNYLRFLYGEGDKGTRGTCVELTTPKPLSLRHFFLTWNSRGTSFLSDWLRFAPMNYSHSIVPTISGVKNVVSDKDIYPIVSHNNRVEVVWKWFLEKKFWLPQG